MYRLRSMHIFIIPAMVVVVFLGLVGVVAQEDCEPNCTNEQKVELVCEDISFKIASIFDPIDARYRLFQEKYSKNQNLIRFSIKRFGELGIDSKDMEDVFVSVETNNSSLSQLFDTMTRDINKIESNCGKEKIDLQVIKIQADRRNFDRLMSEINEDLKTLKTLIENI